MTRHSILLKAFSILILTHGLAQAQTGSRDLANSRSSRVLVAAHSGQNNLRFTALGIARAIRLEVFNQAGDRVFDSGQRDGSILDWRIGEESESMLPNGLYGCLITVSELDGKQSQHRGAFWFEGRSIRMGTGLRRPADSADAQETGDAVSLLQEEELPVIQMLHDGTVGRIVTGRGGLSFSTGNLLADSDVELMRITSEGNVGLGIAEPAAKLDVAGLIRTSGGIQFSDGSILRSANGLGGFGVVTAPPAGTRSVSISPIVGANSNTGTTRSRPNASGKALGTAERIAASGDIGRFNGTEGSTNTFYGLNAGNGTMTGNWNSFFGAAAGSSNTTGSDNSFIGFRAGFSNTTGDSNSFFGSNAGLNNTTGITNSFFGDDAGRYNSTGSSNSFFGDDAGQENNTGVDNSFFGARAGGENTTGGHNSFFGYGAGEANTSGSENAFFGDHAGYFSIGYSNSFFGAYSDGASGITNATAIGYRAQVTQSNSLVLGGVIGINGATADTRVGVGTTAPQASLHVQNGDIYVGTPSQGVILKSPNGTKCAKLSIDDSGALIMTPLACPGAAPPQKATLISPTGTIQGSTPIYKWNAVSNASWYQLWVNDSSTSSGKIKIWYTAAQVGCSSGAGTCSITPSTALASGNARWWIQTWNEFGYGDWSDGMSFTVP